MAVRLNLDQRTITLSVGDLVAEPLAAGRVGGLSQWTRLAIGRETHATHQLAQAGQHANYAREVAVRYKTTIDDFAVTIQGRIDGVIPGDPTVIEEIKSAVLPPLLFASVTPDQYPGYVEQLRLYCYFLRQGDHPDCIGRLVFINAADNTTRSFDLPEPFDEVAGIITERIRLLIGQARDEQTRLVTRRQVAGNLPFPHPSPRRHQD